MRVTCRTASAAHPLRDRETWPARIGQLWDGASFREERYAAIAPSGDRHYAGFQDLWRHRASIICQVGAKTATDVELLVDVLAPNHADQEFFIRKAIGWALRDYARTDPDWVRGYLAAHRDELSGRSRRAAAMHL